MEKMSQGRDSDAINAILFGDDNKIGRDSTSKCTKEDIWRYEMNNLLKNAKTKEAFGDIYLKLNYAVENDLKINIRDYKIKVAVREAEMGRYTFKNLETEVNN